jgi:hypothetical protein
VADARCKTKAGGYGSRLSPGRRDELSLRGAEATKQSSFFAALDCFASLAMTIFGRYAAFQ